MKLYKAMVEKRGLKSFASRIEQDDRRWEFGDITHWAYDQSKGMYWFQLSDGTDRWFHREDVNFVVSYDKEDE